MMGRAGQKLPSTAAEYFELEAQSKVRHESFEGEGFAMAGSSRVHNTIHRACYGNGTTAGPAR
jgi:hypothetical protein